MKIIRIIIQGMIWIIPVISFWCCFYLWSEPTNKIVAWVACLVFGIYLSSSLHRDSIMFRNWFNSKLK